jgi:uncharacterized membrane protein (DUF106 family)
MSFLDPVFGPLLQLSIFWIVVIISLVVALLITLIYKWMTDQNLMKTLKTELKELQKEMKTLKDNPTKMMEVQKLAMKTNMKYMMQSMKSTLVTFIPIILIFGWMQANIAYAPLMPGEDFSVAVGFAKDAYGNISIEVPEGLRVDGALEKEVSDGTVKWVLQGEAGEYLATFSHAGQIYDKEILITEEQAYAPILKTVKGSPIKSIQVEHKPIKILNLFGWKIGWLGSYIIFSLIFSMVLRKIMKVY